MTQTTISTRSENLATYAPPLAGPLLVATTGAYETDSALVAARVFAEQSHADVQVVTAVSPVIGLGFAYGMIPYSRDYDSVQRDAQLAAVKAQVSRVVGAHANWPVRAEFGEAAQVIADEAHTRNARLVVLGRGHHSRSARLLGGEPILRVLQLGDTPVFATAPDFTSLPDCVVIATDFSDLSTYAAKVSLSFIADSASIYLVNVKPRVDESSGGWEQDWDRSYKEGLPGAFKSVRDALKRESLTIKPVTLTGDTTHELLEFAESCRADLIVCGAHGHGFFRRLVLGSVATDLVRNANCSLLCVPGSASARSALRSSRFANATTCTYTANEWDFALNAFSQRNAGRLCTIEIDRSDAGAQIQATNVPFVGASYDAHDNIVELMFGDGRPNGRHFSSAIADVVDLDVSTDSDGTDRALRIANRSGQTLVLMR